MSCRFSFLISFLNFKTFLIFLSIFFFSCATHKINEETSHALSANSLRGPVIKRLASLDGHKLAFYKEIENKKPEEVFVRARSEGYALVPVKTLPAMLKEINSGNPVIIFTGESKTALAIGYELRDELVFVHSDKEPKAKIFKEFMREWEQGEYRAFVALDSKNVAIKRDLNHLFQESLKISKLAPAKGKAYIQKLARLDDDVADFHLALAERAASLDKALASVEKAIQADPNRFESWYRLASLQKKAGKKALAQKTSRKILKMFPNEKSNKTRKNLLALSGK